MKVYSCDKLVHYKKGWEEAAQFSIFSNYCYALVWKTSLKESLIVLGLGRWGCLEREMKIKA